MCMLASRYSTDPRVLADSSQLFSADLVQADS